MAEILKLIDLTVHVLVFRNENNILNQTNMNIYYKD